MFIFQLIKWKISLKFNIIFNSPLKFPAEELYFHDDKTSQETRPWSNHNDRPELTIPIYINERMLKALLMNFQLFSSFQFGFKKSNKVISFSIFYSRKTQNFYNLFAKAKAYLNFNFLNNLIIALQHNKTKKDYLKKVMGIQCIKSNSLVDNLPAFTYRNMIKYINCTYVDQNYEFLQLLGKGSYAEVYRTKCKNTGVIRAIKKLDRIKNSKIQPMLMNEYDILKEMDHPNILKIYEIYDEPGFYYIVSQLCPGKELFNILREKRFFMENETAKIFYQLMSAVNYLHSKNVMHRDLKPQNVMYDPSSNILKLIDFGSALRYESQELRQRRRVGTSYYIAPQVIDRSYNQKCDTWSLGIVLYILLSGQPPFKGKADQEVIDNIKKGEYNFKKPIWQNISSEAKMLITQMLTLNPLDRPEVSKLMNHDWFKKFLKHEDLDEVDHIFLKKALNNMQKFKDMKPNNLQGAVFVFIVNFVKGPQDQAQLQKCFKQLDLNGDGMLSLQELTLGLEKFLKTSKRQANSIAQTIFTRIDTNNSGYIDYSQFLVATNNIQMTATEQNLGMAFDYMDEDKNGWLSVAQIQARLGDNVPTQVYQQMLALFQKNKNGEISRKNFIATMSKIMNKS